MSRSSMSLKEPSLPCENGNDPYSSTCDIPPEDLAASERFHLSDQDKKARVFMMESITKQSIKFKEYIKGLVKDQVHCFETRNGERGASIVVDMFGTIFGFGAWLLSKTIYRFFKVRYLNYLYKFDKDGSPFFITFRKRFESGTPSASHEISEFGITLSKLDESPEKCIGVALKYDQDSKRIKLGSVELLLRTNRTTSVYRKNELFGDIFNLGKAAQNMIITDRSPPVHNNDESFVKSINVVIEEIKKVNYDNFYAVAEVSWKRKVGEMDETEYNTLLETAEGYVDTQSDIAGRKEAPGAAVAANGTLKFGGSTRKNKYMSRNTSRKRRLYRKKSRKCKKAYKKSRSRKITRK